MGFLAESDVPIGAEIDRSGAVNGGRWCFGNIVASPKEDGGAVGLEVDVDALAFVRVIDNAGSGDFAGPWDPTTVVAFLQCESWLLH